MPNLHIFANYYNIAGLKNELVEALEKDTTEMYRDSVKFEYQNVIVVHVDRASRLRD